MSAIGATRDNLLQARANLHRRHAEIKLALGIKTRCQHKNFKLRLNKKGMRKYLSHAHMDLVVEYVAIGESIQRICEELGRLKDVEPEEAVA